MARVNLEMLTERLFQSIISGHRPATREVVADAVRAGMSAEELSLNLYWPVVELVDRLYRADQLTTVAQHYATRLLRTLLDQAQAEYAQKPSRGRTICLYSGPTETEELAGQLVADLAEANGYEVYFGGGGVAADEILAEVSERRADVLLMFAAAPQDAPGIRQIIDSVREVNAMPNLQIVVGGGVFKRAEGLAEEIGADLWADEPADVLELLATQTQRRADLGQRTVGRNRRVNKAA